MLKSSDPKLAANKKVAYDFFRVVLRDSGWTKPTNT